MTTPFEWAIGAAIGAVVTITVVKRLGAARARDPILLIGGFFIALRIVVAISDVISRGTFDAPWAVLTVLVAFYLRRRARRAEPVDTTKSPSDT